MELIKFKQNLLQRTYKVDTRLYFISKYILDRSLGIQYQVIRAILGSNDKMYGSSSSLSSHPLFQGPPHLRAQVPLANANALTYKYF